MEQEARNRLLGYPRIDVDDAIVRKAGELLATAEDEVGGEIAIGSNDGYIAAMADPLDDAVLRANVEAFERLGVAVESY